MKKIQQRPRNFHYKTPKDALKCLYMLVIVINSVFKLGRNYYSQTFLEECKYKTTEQVLKSLINEDVENSDDNDDNDDE